MKKFLFFLLAVFTTESALVAQQDSIIYQRVGVARLNYIMTKMPEMKQIEAELKDFEDQLKQMYDSKVLEYEKKYEEYISKRGDLASVLLKAIEEELVSLQQSIRNFENDAQYSFLEKQSNLIRPVKKKVFESIDQIAREHNLFLILNADIDESPMVLHYEDSLDISDAVLSSLGVDPTN